MAQECTAFSQWFFGVPWLEVFRVLTQLLVGLAWPAAIILLGWLFREEISRKFGDIESAGPTGVKFRSQEPRPAVDIQALQLDTANHRPTVREIEEAVLGDLRKIKDSEQIGILVNQLAIARLGRHFEEIYAIIFGSQIEGLRRLESAGGSANLAEAEQFFADVQSKDTEFYKGITFSEWSHYLRTTALLRLEDEMISITELGREFLLYVSAVKAHQTRPH